MRKASGFTSERVDVTGALRFVLGGDDEPYSAVLERFISAIDSLPDGESGELKAAYALEPPCAGMRRIGGSPTRFRSHDQPGPDMVEGLENVAIKHLSAQLLTGWYPASPLAMHLPELHNGVVNESVSMHIMVNDSYCQETREEYCFLAAFDEADYIAVSSSVPAIIEPSNGFQVETDCLGQSTTHKFFAPRPIKRGETYTLAFRSLPLPTDNDQRVTEASRAFRERTLNPTFDAIFLEQKPERIWSFTVSTYFERPSAPTKTMSLNRMVTIIGHLIANCTAGCLVESRGNGRRTKERTWNRNRFV